MDEKTIEEVVQHLSVYLKARKQSSRLIRPGDEETYCVLGAAAFMDRFAKKDGCEAQRLFGRLLSEGVRTESDLRSWISESFPGVSKRRWDASLKRAQEFMSAEIGVYLPEASYCGRIEGRSLSRAEAGECPGILFGNRLPAERPPLLAVFNSRKPRPVAPDSRWLDVMRFFLRDLNQSGMGLAGSTGTLTYDLASALALRRGFLQLLVVPFPLMAAEPRLLEALGGEAGRIPTLSCMVGGAACLKKLPMRCRDRLLAGLSDFHLVLEIRSGGNLLSILRDVQTKSPKLQFIFKTAAPHSANGGNFPLLEEFPKHAVAFGCSRRQAPARAGSTGVVDPLSSYKKAIQGFARARSADLPWGEYLFHYTRACIGPWPGETYHQYLFDLLDGGPLRTGRAAFDCIVRIAREGVLRAGCGMVRGKIPVVCFSALAPRELSRMRKWRRALVRWNVEPYGVAVKRDVLRSLGAKPAIYGGEQVYSKISDPEKYRFQLSRAAPSTSWRHEREWRLAGDLEIPGLKPHQGFFFVQMGGEAEKLCRRTVPGLPVVALNE